MTVQRRPVSKTKRSRKSPTPQAPTGAASPAPTRRRASQRVRGIELQLGYPGKLRPLMTEQSRTETGGYLTVYVGVRGEFLAAGVPPELFPTAGSVALEIREKGASSNLLRATMSVISIDSFELEIDWAHEMPYENSHPAICELARMISIDLHFYCRNFGSPPYGPDLECPINALLADERAVDFRPLKGAPKLQVSAEFYERLQNIASDARMQVFRYGEVFPAPLQAKQPEPKKSSLRMVVDNDAGVIAVDDTREAPHG